MHARHHVMFWLVTLLVLAALVWLLSDVLLPFVAGIALADGTEVSSERVVANVNPKLLYQSLIDPAALDADFLRRIEAYRCESATFRMNVALDALPEQFREAAQDLRQLLAQLLALRLQPLVVEVGQQVVLIQSRRFLQRISRRGQVTLLFRLRRTCRRRRELARRAALADAGQR